MFPFLLSFPRNVFAALRTVLNVGRVRVRERIHIPVSCHFHLPLSSKLGRVYTLLQFLLLLFKSEQRLRSTFRIGLGREKFYLLFERSFRLTGRTFSNVLLGAELFSNIKRLSFVLLVRVEHSSLALCHSVST